MKTRYVTVNEYAKRYNCTPRFVQHNLQNGNAMLGMVTFRKAGHTWLIEVLTSWFDSLTGLPPIQL